MERLNNMHCSCCDSITISNLHPTNSAGTIKLDLMKGIGSEYSSFSFSDQIWPWQKNRMNLQADQKRAERSRICSGGSYMSQIGSLQAWFSFDAKVLLAI
ncbi:hypothetical protein ABKV19_005724 [Rosa sericea]